GRHVVCQCHMKFVGVTVCCYFYRTCIVKAEGSAQFLGKLGIWGAANCCVGIYLIPDNSILLCLLQEFGNCWLPALWIELLSNLRLSEPAKVSKARNADQKVPLLSAKN